MQDTLTNMSMFFFFFFFPHRPGAGGGAAKKFAITRNTKAKPVLDARNKIIQKNRAKIHDARDKLGQIAKRSGDARLKLLQKNIRFLKKFGELDTAVDALKRASNPNTGAAQVPKRAPAALKRPNTLKRAPYQRLAGDDVDMDVELNYQYPSSASLRRTVKNEIAYVPSSTMPPLPTFKYVEPSRRMTATRSADFEVDPFDCYEVPVARPYDVSEPRNLNRSVLGAQMDAYSHKGLRSSSNVISSMEYERSMPLSAPQYKGGSDLSKRYSADENSHLSHEMRVRLQRAPDRTQSAGIFTNPYSPDSRERQITNAGYRIVVSNLHNSVSQSDIKVQFA